MEEGYELGMGVERENMRDVLELHEPNRCRRPAIDNESASSDRDQFQSGSHG
jgi:hypothetical protein